MKDKINKKEFLCNVVERINNTDNMNKISSKKFKYLNENNMYEKLLNYEYVNSKGESYVFCPIGKTNEELFLSLYNQIVCGILAKNDNEGAVISELVYFQKQMFRLILDCVKSNDIVFNGIVSDKYNITDVSNIYNAIIDEIVDTLCVQDCRLLLTGFGSFYVNRHKGHPVQFGDNKKSAISDYRVIKFSASNLLSSKLREYTDVQNDNENIKEDINENIKEDE